MYKAFNMQKVTYLKAALFTFIAIGHPVIFFSFFSLTGDGSFGQTEFFGYKSFYQVSTNTYRINLTVFIIFSVLFYLILIITQSLLLKLIRRKIDIRDYINAKLGIAPILISLLGYFNVMFWYQGMEGNVFGFIFALPLLILTFISSIVFAVHTIRAVIGKYDKGRVVEVWYVPTR